MKMSRQFSFSAKGTNPSSIMIIVGAFFVAIGFGAYSIGISEGWYIVVLGVICIFLGFLMNVSWMSSKHR
jgi:1,4-dihydroxy-2-naphthoate octaprenyltransferase